MTEKPESSSLALATSASLGQVPGALLAVVWAAGVLLLLFPELVMGVREGRAAGLAIIAISLFATARIPEFLTALLFFLVAMLFHIAPAGTVFSGFQSTALWLVFGGLVVGVAINTTGLGRRIAQWLAGCLGGSYAGLVTGMVLVGLTFAFVMPSAMGRTMLLIPIATALADHFGFKPGSNGRTGIVLAATLGSFVPAFAILPANVPNMVLAGMAEGQVSVTLLYGEYLLLHLPVLGIAKAVVLTVLIIRIFPDVPNPSNSRAEETMSAMSAQQRMLAVVLVVMLSLWLTDFVHHISPAWIALGGAFLLLLPGVGVVTAEQFNTKINFGSLFFVAGIIGLGATIQHSGLGGMLGSVLISHLPLNPDSAFAGFMSLSVASTLTGLLTTLPGVPAVLTPLAQEMAQASGLSLQAVVMLQVVGFSTMIFPYQAPPVVMALQLAGESPLRVLKPIALLALVSYFVLLPLDYLWWRFLGWL